MITPVFDSCKRTRCQKIFSLIYTRNTTIPYFLYPLQKGFATYFELVLSTIMLNFIVLISTCHWLISKFVSKFCLGVLGSCSTPTVKTDKSEIG